jgi:hypothetical protein
MCVADNFLSFSLRDRNIIKDRSEGNPDKISYVVDGFKNYIDKISRQEKTDYDDFEIRCGWIARNLPDDVFYLLEDLVRKDEKYADVSTKYLNSLARKFFIIYKIKFYQGIKYE